MSEYRLPPPPWWFCTGWWSPWCVLDVMTGCRFRTICDKHDVALRNYIDAGICNGSIPINQVDDTCWLNEDCIAGHHMDEIECRFPSWTDDAAASEASLEESAEIASRDLKRALRELDGMPASHDADHVRMYIQSALIWLGHDDDVVDADRLADYLARIDNPNHVRTLTDGCAGCGHSLVYCRCNRYMDLGPCCTNCSGH